MILPVIKPKGPTSFRVIYVVRKITGIKTVGHAGTLDPLASGILVVAIGRESTKQIEHLMLTQKEYEADIMLGQSSTTDDSEGEKTKFPVAEIPTQEVIEKTLKKYVGAIEQTPPLY
jgi:tRNA pseudouridine55 synthase